MVDVGLHQKFLIWIVGANNGRIQGFKNSLLSLFQFGIDLDLYDDFLSAVQEVFEEFELVIR